MLMRLIPAAVVALLALPLASAGEAPWSRFRGPNGSGVSDATTVPIRWTDADYNWKVRLPGVGHSSPVVWEKRIFLTCGDPRTAQRLVVCLDASDGRIVWQRDYPSKTFRQHADNSYATATPAADGAGVVVTWSTPENVVLFALDNDGREVWRRELGPFVGGHGTGTSPIIFEDLVVLANEQEDPLAVPEMYGKNPKLAAGKSFLIAVDRVTGKTRWQLDRRTSVAPYSTPCVRRCEDGTAELVFAGTAHGITAVDPATGKVRWEGGDFGRDRCVASPVLGPDLVIVGHGWGLRGTCYAAFRAGPRAKDDSWAPVYEVKKSVPLVPTPLVKDGRLYLWCDDGVVTCLNVTSGEEIWRERVGGAFYGSPVWVNGRLYCIARNGEVVVLAAGDKFKVLARVAMGEPSFATPAVAGGVMYLRTRSQLFSLGGKPQQQSDLKEGMGVEFKH
jgi:outer membrane protein assembly factor BamB